MNEHSTLKPACIGALAAFALLTFGGAAAAQTSAPTAAADAAPATVELTPEQREQLAKEAQNPIGNLTIIPFQSNWNYGIGPFDRLGYNLNIQPVFPIFLNPNLTLITRTILPVIVAPSNAPPQLCASATGCGSTFGIGDTQEQLFLAPRTKPGALIWGVGPAFTFPTATPGALGGGKYNAGIDAVALVMPGRWVIGALVTQQWSVAGQAAQPNQSNFFVQPFATYNFGASGWAIGTSPGISASFAAPGNQKWTVPVGGNVIWTTRVGGQPMSFALSYYTNVQKPQYAAQTQLRFTWSLLFPVRRK